MEVGCSGAGTRLVMGNLHTYCTLCFMCMITSGCNQGAAGEEEQSDRGANVDVTGKQQLKQQCAMLLV